MTTIYSNGNTKIIKEEQPVFEQLGPRGKPRLVHNQFATGRARFKPTPFVKPVWMVTDLRLKKKKFIGYIYKLYIDDKFIKAQHAAFDIKENVSWKAVDKEIIDLLLQIQN